MADDQLFTLKQLAGQLGLPESTVRYYRDAFLAHIPSVGTGRRRRYPAQALAVLRSIAKQYAAGRSRAEIAGTVAHDDGTHVQVEAARGEPRVEDVSNIDLLAAILDGEREQRDALWQMAREIVRLTEVLETQDKVLGEIADRAGVTVSLPAAAPAPRLTAPMHAARADAFEPPPLPPQPPQPPVAEPAPVPPPPVAEPAPVPPPREPTLPHIVLGGHDDIATLRAELEAERQLVERLRQSKLQLEHRAADAEASLEERRGKRPSVLRRLLGSDDTA